LEIEIKGKKEVLDKEQVSGYTASMTDSIHIVIPAFNEGEMIAPVIDEVKSAGHENIIVVDDGSSDNTFWEAGRRQVIALRHRINRGKGAATKTGIEAAKILGARVIVTMDADGQHDPADIQVLAEPILSGEFDVVLGTRLVSPEGMPWHRIVANKIGNFFTWYIYGLWVTDSQSGFRAYSREAARQINTHTDHYEYDSEVIYEIKKNRLKYTEVPIKVRYTDYSMRKATKQGFTNGLKTLYKMIWNILN
jgi:glycosyltransferase involved in cell wall biosynthesis